MPWLARCISSIVTSLLERLRSLKNAENATSLIRRLNEQELGSIRIGRKAYNQEARDVMTEFLTVQIRSNVRSATRNNQAPKFATSTTWQ